MTQAVFALITLRRRAANAVSFALGMIAAIPEYLPRRCWRPTRPLAFALRDLAPARGRWMDGYDCIADLRLALRAR